MVRQKWSPLEHLIDISARLPWPAGIALAALTYGTLSYLTSAHALPSTAEVAGSGVEAGVILLTAVQYILTALLLFVASLSFARYPKTIDLLPVEATPSPAVDVLQQMGRLEFDGLVAKAFRREGYLAVERAGGEADRGVDLELFMGRDRYLVQCRRWRETKVDVAAVRELYQVISAERAVGGFIVTSGSFTDDARVLALGRSIRLVPANSLQTMLTSAGDMSISPVFSRRRDDLVPPACPLCGKAMMSRVSYQGPRAGQLFWGCTSFPACRGSRDYK